MTNAEFYREEINNFKGTNFCNEFIKPIVINGKCDGTDCHYCNIRVALWLMEEYKKPAVDWENVPVDTPILVKHHKGDTWDRRYYAGITSNKEIYAWNDGCTSFTVDGDGDMTRWQYARLWEGSKEQAAEKETEQ